MKKFPIGIQLYSIRDDMAQDFLGGLEKVQTMGYDGVEFAGYNGLKADVVRKALDRLGLKAPSAHVALDALSEDLPGQIDFHKTLGVKYLVVPYLDDASRPGTPRWPEVVKRIRQIGEACQKAGMQLLYHNHDFEFVKLDGEYALDRLYAEVPMPWLATELDTCWVRVAGVNPATYLRQYKGRAPVIHLKDYISGSNAAGQALYALIDKTGKDNKVDVVDKSAFDFRPLGEGQQDIPAILAAAEEAGTEWVIVEQDRSSDRPAMEAMATSRQHLRKLGL